MKTMTDRINKIIEESGLNQSEVARFVGTSPQAIRKWQNGESTGIKAENLSKIAKLGKTTMEYIVNGKPDSRAKEPTPDYNFETVDLSKKDEVPVISMVQAGDWTEAVDPYPMGEGSETLPCPYPHGENTFAVKVKGDSMYPEFREGMIIFIDPSKMPENKDYCIAKLDETNEATFKQFVIEDGQKFLKATNPDWPQKYIQINGNCHLVGKLIGVYMKY